MGERLVCNQEVTGSIPVRSTLHLSQCAVSTSEAGHTGALESRLRTALAGTYQIERELGGGGMARVFLAREVAFDRPVVVKVLSDALSEGLSRDRFRREIMLSANLQHPNIVGVIAAGEAADLPYFVMPLVEGDSVRARLQRESRIGIAATVAVLRDVARALAYAHDRGVVHRDIKPDNILLAGGAAVVADFGVAKALVSARVTAEMSTSGGSLTHVGVSLGTPAYMAPEQVVADPAADQRVDIYSFGITAYEMLAGRTPFAEASISELMSAHLSKEPPRLASLRPDVPAILEALVMQCLEKDPNHRPASADEILKRLDDPAIISGAVPSLASLPAIPAPARSVAGRRWIAIAAVGVLVVAAGFFLSRWQSGGNGDNPDVIQSIAVLPLVLASPDTADAYLAAGITDELMNALSRIPGVRIASRLTARSLASAGGDPAQAARAAGVTMTLEGTVQRRGDRIRVTARLVSASDGFAIWTQTYERGSGDLFAVQNEIATAISSVVRADLSRDALTGALGRARDETPDPAAYDAFLRGHYLLARRGAATLREAATYFEQALARDSMFARAYAELAQTYAVLPLYAPSEGRLVQDRALAAANRAIALDSTLAPAHAALGYIQNASWRWRQGHASLSRAVSLDPNDVSARQWLGENLLVTGDPQGAAREFEAALDLERDSPLLSVLHAVALGAAGEHARSLASVEAAIAADPSFAVARYMAGTVRIYAGDHGGAIADLEEARRLAPNIPAVMGALGFAYARTGKGAQARELLGALRRMQVSDGVLPSIAKIHFGLGEVDLAVEALIAAGETHDSFFASEPMGTPIFEALHAHRRFLELLSLLNLTDSELAKRASGSGSTQTR